MQRLVSSPGGRDVTILSKALDCSVILGRGKECAQDGGDGIGIKKERKWAIWSL